MPVETFDKISFEESCDLLGGNLVIEDKQKKCKIRKGPVSYVVIEKDNNVEVYLQSPKHPYGKLVAKTDGYKQTSCEVITGDGILPKLWGIYENNIPLQTNCVYLGQETAVRVSVNPYRRRITIGEYPYSIIDGYIAYLTFGKKKYARYMIHRNIAKEFIQTYIRKVRSVLNKKK